MKPIRYQNEYLCTWCRNVWQSYASEPSNDRCPVCGNDEAPGRSTKMVVLLEMKSAIEKAESRVLTGVLSWVDSILTQNITNYLDRVNPVRFKTEVHLQYRPQKFRHLEKDGDQVWVMTEDENGDLDGFRLDDKEVISVYDLLWLQAEIERQQEGQ